MTGKIENAFYETVPVQVAAMKSIVEFTIEIDDDKPRPDDSPPSIRTVRIGETVVKFPDGRIEVVNEKEFGERFRLIQKQTIR